MNRMDWCIKGIKKEDRRDFIIKGLDKYIEEANEVISPCPSGDTELEIAETIDFYRAIIEELGGEVK